MSRPHHGPPRRAARVEPERDEVGGAGDDAGAIRMTQRERGDYFGLGARRRLDDADEVYGIGRGIVSRTDGVFFAARARTDAAAYHRDGPFRNLRVDGAADHAVRARQRARQRRLERAPRVRSVAGLDRHRPALVALVAFVCGFVCVFTRRRRVRNRRSVSNGTRGVGGAEKKEWLDREKARARRGGARGRIVARGSWTHSVMRRYKSSRRRSSVRCGTGNGSSGAFAPLGPGVPGAIRNDPNSARGRYS